MRMIVAGVGASSGMTGVDTMPQKPLKPCGHPGCTELVRNGYCDQHRREKEQRRGSAHERGYTSRWQRARLSYLRQHPLCVMCQAEGRVTAATVVDHIIPHKGDQVLFWDVNNHQPLCKMHHDIKTATEDGGFGR